MGEEKLQTFINFALRYMSDLKLPAKRGTFVEFRNGLINLCPVGRSCTQEERDQFEAYDKVGQWVAPFAQLFGALSNLTLMYLELLVLHFSLQL